MNRSYLERMTGCNAVDLALVYGVSISSGKRSAWKRIHDLFWNSRRVEALERDGWQCVNCKSMQHLDVHHIKQRSLGGTHAMDNLETLCRECHRIRHGE